MDTAFARLEAVRSAMVRCVRLFAVLALAGAQGCTEQVPPATSSAPETARAAFFALRVADAEAAAAWYTEVLALQEIMRADAEDGAYRIRMLSGGGLTVELIEQRDVPAAPERHLGLFKVGVFVADLEALHRRLTRLDVLMDPAVSYDETLQVRTFVFRDADGNRLQAFQQ